MTSIELNSRTDEHGVLNISVPLGPDDANRLVRVIVEPLDAELTPEERGRVIRSTSGSISDATFVRHPQGDYESRDELP